MPKRKYTLARSSRYIEFWEVVAESEEEAVDLARDCEPVRVEYQDYIDDEFSIEEVEDELVTFIKSKEPANAS